MNETDRRFEDKVALVTGGTSGIGLATARRLAAEGAAVIIAGRDVDRGRDAVAAIGGRSRFVRCDVTQRPQIDALLASVADTEARLDIVVNAAGRVVIAPFESIRAEHFHATIDTNLTSVFAVCQAALPLLRRSLPEPRGAHTAAIVNVASLSGVAADRGMTAYNAAKAGVINLSRSLALELAPMGIRVNCVSPGAVETPLTEAVTGDAALSAKFAAAIPAGRVGQPDEIAAVIAFVACHEASFMIGANVSVDGGATIATSHPDVLGHFLKERH